MYNMARGETKIGSSQPEFELSRVRVTEGKITGLNVRNPGEIDFGSSQRGFELSGGDCILKFENDSGNVTLKSKTEKERQL